MNYSDVKRLTAIFYGVTRAEIESQSRKRRVSWPRQVAMALCRRYTRRSLGQIGDAFGGRDHTTVLHACSAVAKRVKADKVHAADLAILCAQIEAGAITISSTWSRSFRKAAQLVPQDQAIERAGFHAYTAALKRTGGHFQIRGARLHELAAAAPGSRVLLLRGPGSATREAA